MNRGLRTHSVPRIDTPPVRVRAYLKLEASTVPSAGESFIADAIKTAFNIQRVTYNATGDITLRFNNPMPDENYLVFATCKQAGGVEHLVNVHQSDANRTHELRLFIASAAGGGAVNSADEVHVVIFA